MTRAELTLLIIAAANLLITPWALGGMVIWSQTLCLVLSAAAFATGLFVRGANGSQDAFSRLLRFPIFWLGVAYFAFVGAQMLNPAWTYRVVGEGWQLVKVEHLSWLPHGISETPFKMMNGARVLLIHGAIWLMACGLWVGVTRRRTARLLIGLIAVNGVFAALVFVLQRLTGSQRILWIWDAPADYFVAGFVYKNHAGAYFNLILAACLGLAWWHSSQAERQMKKSHPGLLFVFIGLVVFLAQLFTFARAATLLGLGILIVVGGAFAVRLLMRPARAMPASVIAVLALLGVGFLGVCAISLNTEKVWERFGRLFEQDEASSVIARQIATRATLEMAAASPVVGNGAGGFRFLFPLYQQHHPEIYTRGLKGSFMFWEHAHNDYAQGLAEYGYVGMSFALALLTCLSIALWRAKIFKHPGLLVMLAGPLAILAHAAVDFPLQNPAVLLTSVGCVVVVTRWAQLEPRSRIVQAPFRE